MDVLEAILVGLPGPTHHYAGLSHGNVASQAHAGEPSRPRAAAHQVLGLMRLLHQLDQPVALLPPLLRPDLATLQATGFTGEPGAVAVAAAHAEPALFNAAMSSAAMWAANAGTVIPATDSGDGRCHIFTANLMATSHRALEAGPRAAMLRALFQAAGVVVHDMLTATLQCADEGAANHTRLSDSTGACHIFVYGRDGEEKDGPQRFPARQTQLAQASIVRRSGIDPERVIFVRQQPQAIDGGAFHNDVVMVGQGNRVLVHAEAWCDQARQLQALQRVIPSLHVAEIASSDLTLNEAVACYLFNSQLIQVNEEWVLVAPMECQAPRPAAVIDTLITDGFIKRVVFHELRQSMQGGGGPACLRLRLPLAPNVWSALGQISVTAERCDQLAGWIDRSYREVITAADLADPDLTREAIAAQRELAQVLGVPLSAIVPPGW